MQTHIEAYQRAGGLESGDAVAAMLRAHSAQPISLLARWIVGRRIVTVSWGSQTLVPLFQFAGAEMALRDEVAQVVSELAPALDDSALAAWFVQDNPLLGGATPLQALADDPAAVLAAARAQRRAARH